MARGTLSYGAAEPERVHLARSPPNQHTALAPRSAVREHRHEQDRTAKAHLHGEAPEGAATVDKEDHQGASNPSRPCVGAPNAATCPSGFGHGEDLASGNGNSAASGDQGTRGVHGDPSRENVREDHDDPKTHRAPPDAARADTKGASAEMQKHWAEQAQLVGDQDTGESSSQKSGDECEERAM